MLETFAVAVGTEREKLSIPRLPDPSELIPLKDLKLKSRICKAKDVIKKCSDKIIGSTNDEEVEEDQRVSFVPNYIETYLSICSIKGFDLNECDIPGFKLLHVRAV